MRFIGEGMMKKLKKIEILL